PANPVERYKPNPHASGKNGGHAINLHQFARAGMTLLGRVIASDGHKLSIAPDLKEKVAQADQYSKDRMTGFDEYIRKAGLDIPEPDDSNTDDGGPTDGPNLEEILELDLVERKIATIIWATGFNSDFSWIDLPVMDERGYPIQQRGISEFPGLYFCGLHWMHNLKSGLLLGVGDDARHVTQHIADNRSLG
ncbi:MAG: FAD-dependent oxidoreductase, partial [Rhodospirillales bacterium]